MKSASLLDNDNKVINCIKVPESTTNIAVYCNQTIRQGRWVEGQGNIGDTYDEKRRLFISPQPYPSWNQNVNDGGWSPPVARPESEGVFNWNESTQQWTEVTNG
jgi:hypothetical protein